MEFDLVLTEHFTKKYLKKNTVSKETIIEKAHEIEQGLFYTGEGRVKGSKILFKKRIALRNTSKRKGARILYVLFHRTRHLYVPFAIWTTSESKKERMDHQLRTTKGIQKIIQETITHLNTSSLKK